MPSRPRFSEMLLDRRRQLGHHGGPRASQVLKLKEQVRIAFEEGDFDNIPQSGYAQGMLSSYARYLGLNPRENSWTSSRRSSTASTCTVPPRMSCAAARAIPSLAVAFRATTS